MSEMIEKVAKALEASLFNDHDSHGCRAEGPRDGKDMTVYGHVNLPALACAVITALDQHREEKAGLIPALPDVPGEGPVRPFSPAVNGFGIAASPTKGEES